MRYAGRRIIDAINAINSDDPKKAESFLTFLDECKLFCFRARHDSVDVVSSKIAIDLQITIERIGYSAILAAYSDFPKLVRKCTDVQAEISKSRSNRDDRDKIYSAIEANDLDDLIKQYRDFRASEDMMLAIAQEKKSEHFYGKYGLWVGVVLGVVGAAIGIAGIIVALKH